MNEHKESSKNSKNGFLKALGYIALIGIPAAAIGYHVGKKSQITKFIEPQSQAQLLNEKLLDLLSVDGESSKTDKLIKAYDSNDQISHHAAVVALCPLFETFISKLLDYYNIEIIAKTDNTHVSLSTKLFKFKDYCNAFGIPAMRGSDLRMIIDIRNELSHNNSLSVSENSKSQFIDLLNQHYEMHHKVLVAQNIVI